MEIRTGVTIPIERSGAHVGDLRFDPDDVAFAERVYDLIASLGQLEKGYEAKATELEANTEEDEYGLPKNAKERLKFLRGVCEDMHGKIDAVFGDGTSAMVFGGSLSTNAIRQFLYEITPYMEEARSDKTDKYLNREQRRALKK